MGVLHPSFRSYAPANYLSRQADAAILANYLKIAQSPVIEPPRSRTHAFQTMKLFHRNSDTLVSTVYTRKHTHTR